MGKFSDYDQKVLVWNYAAKIPQSSESGEKIALLFCKTTP